MAKYLNGKGYLSDLDVKRTKQGRFAVQLPVLTVSIMIRLSSTV